MTNGEKYKNEIIEEYQNLLKEKNIDGDGNRMNRAIKEIAYKYCGMRLVGASGTFKWLFKEYKEPPIKLTRLEYELLKYWKDKRYKYIARDRDGSLYLFQEEPSKKEDVWGSIYGHSGVSRYFYDLFKSIEWTDKEPMNIEELLNNCEVLEND